MVVLSWPSSCVCRRWPAAPLVFRPLPCNALLVRVAWLPWRSPSRLACPLASAWVTGGRSSSVVVSAALFESFLRPCLRLVESFCDGDTSIRHGHFTGRRSPLLSLPASRSVLLLLPLWPFPRPALIMRSRPCTCWGRSPPSSSSSSYSTGIWISTAIARNHKTLFPWMRVFGRKWSMALWSLMRSWRSTSPSCRIGMGT